MKHKKFYPLLPDVAYGQQSFFAKNTQQDLKLLQKYSFKIKSKYLSLQFIKVTQKTQVEHSNIILWNRSKSTLWVNTRSHKTNVNFRQVVPIYWFFLCKFVSSVCKPRDTASDYIKKYMYINFEERQWFVAYSLQYDTEG